MPAVIREILEALTLALIVFIIIQASAQNFRVEGSSMSPTLEGQQYLLVNKLVYARFDQERFSRIIPFWQVDKSTESLSFRSPWRGEIIVFNFPGEPRRDFVKRVIGTPGDEVEIRNGEVRVNGGILRESYLQDQDKGSDNMPPVLLAENQYFVMGDNRRHSNDSRDWGPVPEDNILGKVALVYWPFANWGTPD